LTRPSVIVYSFAVVPDLPPVVGAPSFGVLARQIPRLVVAGLNGAGDRGVRFLPLLGPMHGRRQFFVIPDLLPPEQLTRIHGQPEPIAAVVDGIIGSGFVRLRIHDAVSHALRFDACLPFDPLDPLPIASRLLFELSGMIGWQGALPQLPGFVQPQLSYYLVARDDLLSLEAGFEREGEGHWLKAIGILVAAALDEPEVRRLLLDICRRLAAKRIADQEVGALLAAAVESTDDTEFLGQAATLLQSIGWTDAGDRALDSLVGGDLGDAGMVVRLAGHLFRSGRHRDGRQELERALAAGLRTPRILGQLMMFYQRLGLEPQRAAIADELIQSMPLPGPIGRMLAADLVDAGRLDEALLVVARCLEREPDSAALWLELGRTQLQRHDPEAAKLALQAAIDRDAAGTIGAEAQRLRRFIDQPESLADLRELDRALRDDDLETALGLARRITQVQPQLAEGWLFVGVVQQRCGRSDAAIDALRQALSLDPELGEAHNRMGILLVGAGRYPDGYTHLERAIRLLPRQSGPRIHMAQACSYLGKFDEGLEHLQAAAELGGSPPMIESVRRTFFGDVA
jgi:tetratricopeptide (TPR) repeat protein